MPGLRTFLSHRSPADRAVIGLVLILAVGEAYLFVHHYYPLVIGESDGIGYMMRSERFFDFDPHHGPGYSWAIRLFRLVGIDPFSAAKVVSILSTLLLVPAIYRLLSTMCRPGVAALATALATLHPLLVVRSVAIMSDVMALSLAVWALALLFTAPQTRRAAIAAGACAGGAYLSRYVYLFLLGVPIVVALLRLGRAPKEPSGPPGPERADHSVPLWQSSMLFYAGFLAVTAVWLVYVFIEKGSPLYNENHLLIAFRMHDRSLEFDNFPTTSEYPSMLAVIRSDPGLFFRSWLMDVGTLPAALWGFIPKVWIIGAAGVVMWFKHLSRRRAALVAICAVYAGLICLAFLFDRLLLFFLPLLAGVVAEGIAVVPAHLGRATVTGNAAQRGAWLTPRRVVTAIVIGATAWTAGTSVATVYSAQPLEFKRASDWLRHRNRGGVSVFAAKPHIAFFAGARAIGFRDYNLQDIELGDLGAVLDDVAPTYVVYDERYAIRRFSKLRLLAYPDQHAYPPSLRPAYQIDDPMRVVIYEYIPPAAR